MANLHIVIHPGQEPEVNVNGTLCCCNTSNTHKRKFMEHTGDYLDAQSECTTDTLRFWGEYECRSSYVSLGNKEYIYYDYPRSCHTPIAPHTLTCGLNTDPFIFGDKFYYVCCKIDDYNPPEIGDIVLFGTVFKSGENKAMEFHLDTLLVVEEIKDVNSTEKSEFSDIYRRCTLDISPAYTIVYIGKMHSNSEDKSTYSFVPCKVANSNEINTMRFGRPRINPSALGAGVKFNNTQRKKSIVVAIDNISEIFNNIVEQIKVQRFLCGVRFNDPVEDKSCCI